MATLLAHIRVQPGMEARFEEIAAEMHRASHARDRGLVRYEYWRGAEPGTYYALESFDDFLGFVEHQSSDHHEDATPGFREVFADIRLEWVDPIQGSSPLVPTEPRSYRPTPRSCRPPLRTVRCVAGAAVVAAAALSRGERRRRDHRAVGSARAALVGEVRARGLQHRRPARAGPHQLGRDPQLPVAQLHVARHGDR